MRSSNAYTLVMQTTSPHPRPCEVNSAVHSCLRMPADLAAVGFVRSALACVLTREEWPTESAGRVLLASTEAVTNAIEHGSPFGGAVEVELVVTAERAEIRVADEGRPGVACPVIPKRPPPPSSPRGRGLIIISRLADDVDVRAVGTGTVLQAAFLRRTALAAEPVRRAA